MILHRSEMKGHLLQCPFLAVLITTNISIDNKANSFFCIMFKWTKACRIQPKFI